MCHDTATLGSLLNAQPDGVKAAADAEHEPFSTQTVAGLWEWQEEKGWLPFDAPLCDKLESAWQSGSSRCKVSVESRQYDINFTHMWQQNCSTHTTRQIRRSMCKEAPVWYWWNKGDSHRLSIPATMLLEQEYQRFASEGQQEPHEVIWTVEDGAVYTISVLTMQLTEEGGGQSYPITRTLIKADLSHNADTEMPWSKKGDEEEAHAVLLQVPLRRMDSDGYKCSTKDTEAVTFSEKMAPADQRRPTAVPSLRISVEGAAVSIQVPHGGPTTIHVAAPQQMEQQTYLRKQENQNHFSLGSSGDPCAQIGRSVCCCTCKSTCCGCGHCAKVKSSCPLRWCCCCCGWCGSNANKGVQPSDGSVAASECDQCNLLQREGAPAVVDTAVGRSPVSGAVRPDDGAATQLSSSSTASSISPDITVQPEGQHSQIPPSGKLATLAEQLLLQQQALELQHSNFLNQQEERTKRHIHLEQQQQALHQQQQQLIDQLQLQLDALKRKQAEVREHQQLLELQQLEQQLPLTQQAGEVGQLRPWDCGNVADAGSLCEGKQQTQCLAEAPEPEAKREGIILKDVEPSTSSVALHPRRNPPTTEAFLSSADKEHIIDDEYTCI